MMTQIIKPATLLKTDFNLKLHYPNVHNWINFINGKANFLWRRLVAKIIHYFHMTCGKQAKYCINQCFSSYKLLHGHLPGNLGEGTVRGNYILTYRIRRAHIPRLPRLNSTNAGYCLILKRLQMYNQMPNLVVDQTSLYSFKRYCATYIKSI